jgi:diguanylate cyclase (GGDEF)-like protein
MMLDLRTIVVLIIVSTVLMTVALAVGLRAGRGAGFAKWNLGLGLLSFGWILIAARGVLPEIVTHALADALLLAGLCLQAAAVMEFDGRRPSRWLLFAPGPLFFAMLAPVTGHLVLFTVVASFGLAAAIAGIAVLALSTARPGATRWTLAAPYLAASGMLLVRATHIAIEPEEHIGAFAADAIDIGTYLTFFAGTLAASFAFLILQRERAEAEIRHLAMFDGLTEFLNRRAFLKLGEREIARARRAHAPVAALMMDLDHFKRVNDVHGHAAGDAVLAGFADVVRRCVRAEDLTGRYGGEEFCALLPGLDPGAALAAAERIRAAVAAQPLGGLPAPVTVSIGVAIDVDGEAPLDALLARADEALYQAKHAGRNRVASLGPMPTVGEPRSAVSRTGPAADSTISRNHAIA